MSLSAAQLELLILAERHPRGASWPPPSWLVADVELLLSSGLLQKRDRRVRLSEAGAAAIAQDCRTADITAEMVAGVHAGRSPAPATVEASSLEGLSE